MSKHMLQHPGRNNEFSNQPQSTWRCHYCGDFCHIKPFCFKLYGDQKSSAHSKASQVRKKKSVKDRDVNLIDHTSLRASNTEDR